VISDHSSCQIYFDCRLTYGECAVRVTQIGGGLDMFKASIEGLGSSSGRRWVSRVLVGVSGCRWVSLGVCVGVAVWMLLR